MPIRRRTGALWLLLFALLLMALPLLAQNLPNQGLALVDAFYRAGALVFGGGHVVLPLLQAEVVPPQWISNDLFLAGYGAAQAVPGPLFTFAAFLGAAMQPDPNGWLGGLICLPAIFAPSFLLVFGALPLGNPAPQPTHPSRPDRRECRRGGPAVGRAVSPGVDQRDFQRLRPRFGRARAGGVDGLEVAAVAGGGGKRWAGMAAQPHCRIKKPLAPRD